MEGGEPVADGVGGLAQAGQDLDQRDGFQALLHVGRLGVGGPADRIGEGLVGGSLATSSRLQTISHGDLQGP